MKTKPGYFIALPKDFSVSVPKRSVPGDEHFVMEPSGLYITYNFQSAWIQYAGEDAAKSYAVFEIPSDSAYLRKLGRELNKLAKQIESERER